MRSDLQIEASRANGSKSQSKLARPYPRNTEAETRTGGQEGKLASSRNALKHGMLSQYILIPGESAEAFHALAADLFAEFRPLGSTEEDLVEMMVAARWRRMRIWSLEKTCFTKRMSKEYCEAVEPLPNAEETAGRAFAALANETRTLDLVNRYESRYDRQYFRAHRRLLDIQDRRMRNEPANTPPPAPGPEPVPDEPKTSDFANRTQASVENTAPPAPAARLSHWQETFADPDFHPPLPTPLVSHAAQPLT